MKFIACQPQNRNEFRRVKLYRNTYSLLLIACPKKTTRDFSEKWKSNPQGQVLGDLVAEMGFAVDDQCSVRIFFGLFAIRRSDTTNDAMFDPDFCGAFALHLITEVI